MASLRAATLTSVRFIFCAIPGLLLFLTGFVLLILGMEPEASHRWARIAGGAGALAAGAPLVLYGTGRWRRWGYILPFLALPAVIFAFDYAHGSCWFALIPFAVAAGVHAYYRRRT